MTKPVCAVVGVLPADAAAFARRFTAEGYAVALVARTTKPLDEIAAQMEGVATFECDVTSLSSAVRTFRTIRKELGEVEILIYGPAAGAFGSLEPTTPEAFEVAAHANSIGALAVSRQVIPFMQQAKRGSIFFIGTNRNLAESISGLLASSGVRVTLLSLGAYESMAKTVVDLVHMPPSERPFEVEARPEVVKN
jgi:NAD(P)-dependent dehydrogenase (short-subunit alcohol dehydrogenase family)